jgi:hypothetical protein
MNKWSNYSGTTGVVQNVGQRFFPLDEELELLPGRYTPGLQETMTRLGGKMPFPEAEDEIRAIYRTEISEPTIRRTTHENGQASEAVERQAVEEIEATLPEPTEQPERMVISTDGAFIGLTNGEWREVKTVSIGEFTSHWNAKKSEIEVKSSELSYFSRSYPARDFERYALAEIHRRGMENAEEIVTVNDGATWIQSFIDYHCPKAVRIIDFAHALGYVSRIGKTILGEETAAFNSWFETKAHQLKHEPPHRLLSELAWFGQKAETIEQETVTDAGLNYLSRRKEMIDYAHFRARGYPIGSGSVESSHKHVVHKRLKGAGMRWAEHHVDPLLALRNLIANRRWDEGWQQLVNYRLQQRWNSRQPPKPKSTPPPLNLKSIKVAPEPAENESSTIDDAVPKKPWRPPPDHPWRQPLWPSHS